MKLHLAVSTLCLFLSYTLQSCTGNNTGANAGDTILLRHVDTIYVVPPASAIGLWIGTYNVVEGIDAGEKNFYYSFNLHTNNKIQITGVGGDGMTYYAIGTWSLRNTSLSAHVITTNLVHTGVPQTIIATYDSINNKLTGTVTNDIDNFKASFELEKAP